MLAAPAPEDSGMTQQGAPSELSLSLLGGRSDSMIDHEIKELTDQFYVTLRAYRARLHPPESKATAATLQRVDELLDPRRQGSWSEAYEVEQLLIPLFDDDTLRTELEVRVVEANGALRTQLADLSAKEVAAAGPAAVERRRSLLARLVNDLQWRYTVNEVKRRYSKEITSRTGRLSAAALALFAIWTTVIVLWKPSFAQPHFLVLAGIAGAWGAAFSMLLSLKGRLDASELDDLKLMRPYVMLIARTLIGAGAGCLVYFFVRSGLLGGTAFPNLLDATKDWGTTVALLIVWCVIAGFSEKLVPALLEKTEARATTVTERYRPGSNGEQSRERVTSPANASKAVETP
jgi:hypothetical protein